MYNCSMHTINYKLQYVFCTLNMDMHTSHAHCTNVQNTPQIFIYTMYTTYTTYCTKHILYCLMYTLNHPPHTAICIRCPIETGLTTASLRCEYSLLQSYGYFQSDMQFVIFLHKPNLRKLIFTLKNA